MITRNVLYNFFHVSPISPIHVIQIPWSFIIDLCEVGTPHVENVSFVFVCALFLRICAGKIVVHSYTEMEKHKLNLNVQYFIHLDINNRAILTSMPFWDF